MAWLIYVRWNSIKNHKDEEGDLQRKNKTMNEIKPVETINKNPQSFLEISPVQKEVVL